MKTRQLLFAFAMLMPISKISFAQGTFQKSVGGSMFEYGYAMQKTADGGYVVGASTSSFGANGVDFYVIKYDANCTALWNKIYDNAGTGAEPINDIFQTTDRGYIVGGYTQHLPNVFAYIVKTDSIGDTLWTRYWGRMDTTYSDCYLVTQTSDGNVLIGGYTTSYGAGMEDAFLLKLDVNTGDTLWTRVWGGPQNEWLYSMQETADGGIILAGLTNSFGAGDNDILLIKTDANGNIEWAKAYGDTASQFGYGHCLQQTSDHGYIITGNGGFLLKTDSIGTVQWQKTYNGSFTFTGHAVQQTTDGGYIVGGSKSNGTSKACLIKTDSVGNVSWSMFYGGTSGELCFAIKQADDGGYFMSGQTSSFGTGNDIYLVKTDANGISGCNESTANAVASFSNYSTANAPLQVNYGSQTQHPTVSILTGYQEISLCSTVGTSEFIPSTPYIAISTNPFSTFTTLNLQGTCHNPSLFIYNLLGQVVETYYNTSLPNQQITIPRNQLSSGMYFYKVIDENKEVLGIGKMIIE